MLKEIKIRKKISFEELCNRLRKVQLKGFPNICVYENASFEILTFDRQGFTRQVSTPQPTVYQDILNRIKDTNELFLRNGVNIFDLNGGIEYLAIDDKNEQSVWTLLPPIIETQGVNITKEGEITYDGIIGQDLENLIRKENFKINPDFYKPRDKNKLPEKRYVICDGSHRIETAFQLGELINVLLISNIMGGFPYYAVPQDYDKLHIIPNREGDPGTKIHVIKEPGHKSLYRLFPSARLYTGGVRADSLK